MNVFNLDDPFNIIEFICSKTNLGEYSRFPNYNGQAIFTPKTDYVYDELKSLDDLLVDVGKQLFDLKKADAFFVCPKKLFNFRHNHHNKHGFYRLFDKSFIHIQAYSIIHKDIYRFMVYSQDKLGDNGVARQVLFYENQFKGSAKDLVEKITQFV